MGAFNPILAIIRSQTSVNKGRCSWCGGKGGQYWKSHSNFEWKPCPKCNGNKQKGTTS